MTDAWFIWVTFDPAKLLSLLFVFGCDIFKPHSCTLAVFYIFFRKVIFVLGFWLLLVTVKFVVFIPVVFGSVDTVRLNGVFFVMSNLLV